MAGGAKWNGTSGGDACGWHPDCHRRAYSAVVAASCATSCAAGCAAGCAAAECSSDRSSDSQNRRESGTGGVYQALYGGGGGGVYGGEAGGGTQFRPTGKPVCGSTTIVTTISTSSCADACGATRLIYKDVCTWQCVNGRRDGSDSDPNHTPPTNTAPVRNPEPICGGASSGASNGASNNNASNGASNASSGASNASSGATSSATSSATSRARRVYPNVCIGRQREAGGSTKSVPSTSRCRATFYYRAGIQSGRVNSGNSGSTGDTAADANFATVNATSGVSRCRAW